MGDDFTRKRLRWLQDVAADSVLTASSVRVAVIIATRFLNREKGYAWPSQETLARACGMKKRRTQDALYDLKRRGYLTISEQHGPLTSNRYFMKEKTQSIASLNAQEIASFDPQCRKSSEEMTQVFTCKDAEICAQFPLKEPFEEPVEYISSHFNEFWKAYPNPVRIQQAKEEFEKSIVQGDKPEHIILGAKRFADECTGKPKDKITWPESFLKDRAWRVRLSPFELDPEAIYRFRLDRWRETKLWDAKHGPSPGAEGCTVPPEVFDRWCKDRKIVIEFEPQRGAA